MKVGIITINDNNNYGNRLQNYATQEILEKKLKIEAITIRNSIKLNVGNPSSIKYFVKFCTYKINLIKEKMIKSKRKEKFQEFDNLIKYNEKTVNLYGNYKNIFKEYDYYIAGSDQIWNPHGRMSNVELLTYADKSKRISFAASFGVQNMPENKKSFAKEALNDLKSISVREEAGKKIIEDLTNRKDIQVLIDPTMLLTNEEWDKVAKKPEQLKTDKYILNYFLGELSQERKDEISRVAQENNCEIINILDKDSPFYQTGPSEFLYLEKNAFLICTDSFHSSVFAILYNRPFLVFNREDNNISMNSRIETLINKFNLKNREYTGNITNENLMHDYTEAYKILEEERKKSIAFLQKALDI